MVRTDAESTLEVRLEELAAMGYGVEVETLPRGAHRVAWEGRGGGMPWRSCLLKKSVRLGEGYGFNAIEALEDAVNQARSRGEP